MNDRAEFLQRFRALFIKMVDRLESMTETEALDGLRHVKAARIVYKEEFFERIKATQAVPPEWYRVAGVRPSSLEDAFAHLSSIQVFVNSVNKLRSRLGVRARPVNQHVYATHPSFVFDSLELALNERIEMLRRRPGGGS
jgi:hypothetical protein